MKARLRLGEATFEVELYGGKDGAWKVVVDGDAFEVKIAADKATVGKTSFALQAGTPTRLLLDGAAMPFMVESFSKRDDDGPGGGGPVHVRTPMTGRVESVRVAVGQAVQKGEVLFVLEAMKMLNEVKSPASGTVQSIHVIAGKTVEPGKPAIDIHPA